MASLNLTPKILKSPLFILIIFLLLFSGCSHYSNIPRQRIFFITKPANKLVKERTQFSYKNNKDKIAEVQNDSIISEDLTEDLSHKDIIDKDSQQIKSKPKFFFNHAKNTFLKQSIALTKSSFPKVFRFHETKKSIALKNKLAKRKAFPLVLIMLGVAIGLIGIIFGIGYLTEKINGPIKEAIPEAPIDSKKDNIKHKKNLANISLFLGILSLLLLITVPIIALIAWQLIYLTLFIVPIITSLVAIILGIKTLLSNNKFIPDERRNRKLAIIGIVLGGLTLLPFILILAFN